MGNQVTYLYHSGFAVELSEHVLIFDHTKGQEPCLPAGKRLLWFASHKHGDHFQLSALRRAVQMQSSIHGEIQLQEGMYLRKSAHYFVGKDIRLNRGYLERNGISGEILNVLTRMGSGQVYEEKQTGLRVEALCSTDQGVAFLVTVEGVCIYHAGDLNDWYWAGESESANQKMRQDYRQEIDKLAGRQIDIAFVPLDPRLEEGSGFGMDYFLQKTEVKTVFPMHMWEDYQVIDRYKETEIGKRYREKIQDITEENQVFLLQN